VDDVAAERLSVSAVVRMVSPRWRCQVSSHLFDFTANIHSFSPKASPLETVNSDGSYKAIKAAERKFGGKAKEDSQHCHFNRQAAK
jgi:hypothetical protein